MSKISRKQGVAGKVKPSSEQTSDLSRRGGKAPGLQRAMMIGSVSHSYENAGIGALVADALLSALDRCGDKWAIVEALRVFALENDKEASTWHNDAALIPFFRAAEGMPGLDAIHSHVDTSLHERRPESVMAVVASCACWITDGCEDDHLESIAHCGFGLAERVLEAGMERRKLLGEFGADRIDATDIKPLLECITSITAGAPTVKKAS